MSLALKLAALAEAGRPVRVGLIGAGKFGSMFLSQAPRIRGLHAVGIADLHLDRARRAVESVGWPTERTGDTLRDRCDAFGRWALPRGLGMEATFRREFELDAGRATPVVHRERRTREVDRAKA